MFINHHPDSELLTAFAAGSLPLSQALCVSTHIEMCQQCQANNRRLKRLGAFVFDASAPAKVSRSLKDSVLKQLDAPSKVQVPVKVQVQVQVQPKLAAQAQQGALDHAIPKSLRQFIPNSFADLSWKRVSPSIKQVNLCTDGNGAQVALLSINPGGKSGVHTHMGEEITMILKGAFSDETGIFQKGDFVLRDSRHKHKPIATKDGECICLTVLDAPIQFTGVFTRWLNPLLRRSYDVPKGLSA
ncbi:MAG: putative transcriptional regulator [Lentisphaeria bacterium]|jgi:putative transcriptional regulator